MGPTNSTSVVVIPVGTPVVLHGCAQPNSTVAVMNITVPLGATVSQSASSLPVAMLPVLG